MYIQEVVIDGFKSYAHKTVVQGFDPHFNAITGLNGSGKSNILDSICFVLGITNLSQVRAGSLSELVYKQGQAGVNKATVTIVFNNEDEANSPVGYEQHSEVTVTRQVLIGGKSKYLINGRNAPANQVQNLFHSVQLNVNNPHFLIMQGRITKVLNMKPHEILGMVEEAAGTRMYENKRVAAIKTIDKKQMKVDELNSVLSEEITPTLERLRGEKQKYLKWSKNNADIERIQRFVIANDYVQARKALDGNVEGVSEMEDEVESLQIQTEEGRQEISKKEDEINDRTSKLAGEFDSKLKSIKATEEKVSKELVKVTSAWQNSKSVVQSAEEDLQAAKELVTETQKSIESKEAKIDIESRLIESEKLEAQEAETQHEQLQLDYQNMNAGISSSQGDEAGTLPQQIAKAHSDSKTAEAKANQAEMKMKHLTKTLKTIKEDLNRESKSAEKLSNKKLKAISKVEDITGNISKLSFSEEEYNGLEREKMQLDAAASELKDTVETLSAQLEGRLRFKYADPVRGFDRSKVKGLVAKLVKVNNTKNATALEVVAGSKLYQVVVDDAITGKALLNKGKLERRVTIIPLDKIQPRRVTSTACQRASDIAKSQDSTSSPAIELVGFDEEVRTAMEYVFGSTLVVDGMKAANQICDATRTRTVTLDGDVYDPSGTISGGSNNNLGSTLSQLTELATSQADLDEKEARLFVVDDKLNSLKSAFGEFEKLSQKLELANAELAAVEKHLSQTKFGMILEKHDAVVDDITKAEAEFEQMTKEKLEKWNLHRELQEREQELTQQREEKLSQICEAVQEAKTTAAEKARNAREAESRAETSRLELESVKAELAAAEEAMNLANQALEEANEAESDLQIKVGEVNVRYEAAKADLNEAERSIEKLSKELCTLKSERNNLQNRVDELELEAKKMKVQIGKIEKDRANAEKAVAHMLKKYSWIESEKSAFGVEGGDYDFSTVNVGDLKSQLGDLESEQDTLSKKINKKVMGMIEKAEAEYTELLRKRKVVENDKKKIQAVIEELDVKKKSELERTWVKVNRDFGSIFSTLLPGASAKLEPPEGLEAWEGLEVKVAFGNVWKESLSELSGGQRSLIALSLILSLLLFKPAPMYILDEVDAALDLSHTQNIGNMLKTHFSQSQFIVVSLKEGMFNNANVIFRTKFVDGVSTVTKTMGTGSSAKSRNATVEENEDRSDSSLPQKRPRNRSKAYDKENRLTK
mmetsp:Transcript_18379/g.27767  ORF Transcript_18379/g.27767 Transcript_18379/m.27767 type:complete len:1218 (-) Transcript_18379:74-3727(-)